MLTGHEYFIYLWKIGKASIVIVDKPVNRLTQHLHACSPYIAAIRYINIQKHKVVANTNLICFIGSCSLTNCSVRGIRKPKVKCIIVITIQSQNPTTIAILHNVLYLEIPCTAIAILHRDSKATSILNCLFKVEANIFEFDFKRLNFCFWLENTIILNDISTTNFIKMFSR